MKLAEKFLSINGEGVRAGELAVFLRFKGCNLNCGYCDTKWANKIECPYEEKTPQELYEYILGTKVRNVTLTGGEPLLQADMPELLKLLLNDDYLRVEIETNGAVALDSFTDIDGKRPIFTMDYKLPSSGCEQAMKLSNFDLLCEHDTVKFVSGSMDDLNRAYEIITKYSLTKKCHVYFSPVFGSIEPVQIVEFMIQHNINEARIQLQLHKFIWSPDTKGV